MGQLDKEENAREGKQAKGYKMDGPVAFLLPVKLNEMPAMLLLVTMDIGGPVGKPGPYIEEKADDRHDGVKYAGGDGQLEKEIRFVWFVHNYSFAARR